MIEPIAFKLDTDKISVDAYLEIMELGEALQGKPKAADLRRFVELIKPAIVDLDLGTLPYNQLVPAMRQVSEALNDNFDPN